MNTDGVQFYCCFKFYFCPMVSCPDHFFCTDESSLQQANSEFQRQWTFDGIRWYIEKSGRDKDAYS